MPDVRILLISQLIRLSVAGFLEFQYLRVYRGLHSALQYYLKQIEMVREIYNKRR